MPQAIVDPEELRRFAQSLKKFSNDVQERVSSLGAQMVALERISRDQEQKKFSEEFEQHIRTIARFIEVIEQHIPYLHRKADIIEDPPAAIGLSCPALATCIDLGVYIACV